MSAVETYTYSLCPTHGFPRADYVTCELDQCPGCLFAIGRHAEPAQFLASIDPLIAWLMERWYELDCLEFLGDLHDLADAERERVTRFAEGAAVQE